VYERKRRGRRDVEGWVGVKFGKYGWRRRRRGRRAGE